MGENLFSNIFSLGEYIFNNKIKGFENQERTKSIRKYLASDLLEEVIEIYEVKIDKNIVEKINKNIENYVKNFANKQNNVKIFEAELISRHPGLIISSGNYVNLVLENGIFFDVFTNAPKIPESSINGALHRILNFKLKNLISNKKEKTTIKLTTISGLGFPENGETNIYKVITMNNSYLKPKDINYCKEFFEKISTELNIYNIRIKEKLKLLSTEFLDPLPIHLILIPENIRFKLFFIFKEEHNTAEKNSLSDALNNVFGDLNGIYTNDELLKDILKLVFEIYGLGSKTAYGFGKFKINSMGWLKND